MRLGRFCEWDGVVFNKVRVGDELSDGAVR